MASGNTLVLGIGNTLLTDEGAGIHALQLLQSEYNNSPNLRFLDGGTLSFTLACYIEECTNLLVFDAAELEQPAGTVQSFTGDAMDHFLGTCKRSAHEVGLLDLMDIARITYHLPANRALVGIQPEQLGWGMQPSESVQSALRPAVDEALRIITTWQEASCTSAA